MSSIQRILNAVGCVFVFVLLVPTHECFTPKVIHPASSRASTSPSSLASSTPADDANDSNNDAVVRSPMRFLGPYPTMPLRFPNLATPSQRERNVTGISLDWILDTAANVNTINAQVALELGLEKVGEAPGGVGAAGSIMGGDTFMLGDANLDITISNERAKESDDGADDDDGKDEGKEKEEDEFEFIKELTASALPVASPAAAGLLGLAFFYCFEGGVEFDWGSSEAPPSVTFHGSDEHLDVKGMARVPFESLPVSMLPSVTISINGKEFPALFDTGSPITVLNARAAEAAGIETAVPMDDANSNPAEDGKGGWNPFSKLKAEMRAAQEMAKATASGDVLTIAGAGGPVRLVKSKSAETVGIVTSTGQEPCTIGTAPVFVGDLPGLAALGGLGGEAPPAAVLGMDLLRLRPKVVFRAQQNEIYL